MSTVFRPLAGVKVLELSQLLAGPACGLMLADLGADVIKIERFPAGDDARRYIRRGDSAMPPSFMMLNRGKRSVGIDLKSADGVAVLKRLVKGADVMTENFRLGVMERLGVGYEELRAINPALVFCSISGFGRKGPMAEKGGFDVIMQAFSGIMSVTGEEGGGPVKPGISVADVNAGILAAFGILAAYIERLKSGQGTRVDTSLLQASLQQMYWFAAAYFHNGTLPKRNGTAHALIAPYQVYECADGSIAIGGGNQSTWLKIADVLGHPEWKTDPRFELPAERLANRHGLEILINKVLAGGSLRHWLDEFDAAGVPVGPVNTVGEALDHEQSRAVEMVIDVDSPAGGSMRALGLPVLFNGRSENARSVPPRVGEHTMPVLREFGFTDGELEALQANQTIANPHPNPHASPQ